MYIFSKCYSLHKALQSIYVIDIQLCLITLITLIPIAQKNKGKEIDIYLVIALLKLFEFVVVLIVMRRVILQYRMKYSSKIAYCSHLILLITVIVQDIVTLH